MEVGEQPCKSWFLIDSSFKDTILANGMTPFSLRLSKCPADFKPLLYRRYVDDCFLLFKSTDQIPQFLDFLNRQHHNIKFTREIESNSTLPFLDISIIRKNGVFETSVYQKPTFTGLFTNFQFYSLPI